MSGPHRGASELLDHFIPGKVLLQARDLALRYKRDEVVRVYAEKRILLVLSTGLFCMLLSALVAGGAVAVLFQFLETPLGPLMRGIKLVLAIVIWLCGTMFLLYRFFDWLEKKALKANGPAGADK